MSKKSDTLSSENLSRYDQLLALITNSNQDFAKASTDSNARIECKVQSPDLEKFLFKVAGKVFLHVPLRVRVLSKGTKASLILLLGVEIELCKLNDESIGWCNYKFDSSKLENSVKSSNCDGVSDEDLIEYFFKVVSTMQFYAFDEEIKALMDYCEHEQTKLKLAYEQITFIQPDPLPDTLDQTIDPDESDVIDQTSEDKDFLELMD